MKINRSYRATMHKPLNNINVINNIQIIVYYVLFVHLFKYNYENKKDMIINVQIGQFHFFNGDIMINAFCMKNKQYATRWLRIHTMNTQ